MQTIYFILLILLGIVANLLEKKVKGETWNDVVLYITTHYKSTALTLIGAIVGYFIFKEVGQLNYISSFAIGYLANTWINKAAIKADI